MVSALTSCVEQAEVEQAGLEQLLSAVAPLQQRLRQHVLYTGLQEPDSVRQFMSHHVFAVWDFMSLLKALQQQLSCTTVPWMPGPEPESRRLINEIVLAEESDRLPDGRSLSHFEWYVESMKTCGSSTDLLDQFFARLQTNSHDVKKPTEMLHFLESQHFLPEHVQTFLHTTWEILATQKPHCIAAAFTLGRENIIPDMFTAVIQNLSQSRTEFAGFADYLHHHVELDGDTHGPQALRMLSLLCEDENTPQTTETRWREATTAAKQALHAREILWNGIAASLSL